MKISSLRNLMVLSIALVIAGCANKSSPTGGPKDEDPPVLDVSKPVDQQLNFKEKQIELTFNELIKLDNLKEQLIITPKLNQEFVSKYKKNKVILEFDEPLDSNTTYTFIFREGIKDLNEGNVPPNLMLAFSTGDYMDSLSISGEVIDLLTQLPINDATVALYQSGDTLDLFNSSPIYLAKTNKTGQFIINNIKKGSYKIYALIDKNKNLLLESSTEKYGFYEHTIELDSNITDIKLELFGLDTNPLELQSARTSGHYFIAKYNKNITEYTINSNTSDTIFSTLNNDGKEIKFYNTLTQFDSLLLTIDVTDSMRFQSKDSVYLKFEETKRDKDKYDIKVITKDIDPNNPKFDITINFSKPSLTNQTDSLFIELDTLNKIYFSEEEITWNEYQTQLIINKPINKSHLIIADTAQIKTRQNFALKIREGAFISIEQDSSSNINQSIKVINSKNVGLIKVQVSTEKENYVVQLLNKKKEVVQEVKNIKNYTFNNLNPGEYSIRVLIDSNNDGKWQMGNILTNISSEPVLFYKSSDGNQVLTLRANWELGPNLISF